MWYGSTARRRTKWLRLVGIALMMAASIALYPKEAIAATYPTLLHKFELGETFTEDELTLQFYFRSDYKYNKYTAGIYLLGEDEPYATFSDDIDLITESIQDVNVKVDTTGWPAGAYHVYAQSQFYSLNKWNESPNNVNNNSKGSWCGAFLLKKSIAGDVITLSDTKLAYNGGVRRPSVISVGNRRLKEGTDYTVNYSNPNSSAVGAYSVSVTGMGNYFGTSASKTYWILRSNTLTAKAKAVTAKPGKTVKAKKAFVVKKPVGKVTYKKSSGNSKIVVTKKGDIKIKKGLKPGTYKVKVNVTAAGDALTAKKTVKVSLKVKVK